MHAWWALGPSGGSSVCLEELLVPFMWQQRTEVVTTHVLGV